MRIFILAFYIVLLTSCATSQVERNSDSSSYYFGQDLVYNGTNGEWFCCGLPRSGSYNAYEYFKIDPDSTVILVKAYTFGESSCSLCLYERKFFESDSLMCWLPNYESVQQTEIENLDTLKIKYSGREYVVGELNKIDLVWK